MTTIQRQTPVALAALIHTLRKAMRPEGKIKHYAIEWETNWHLPLLEEVHEALKADVITAGEAAKKTMEEIDEWLQGVMDSDIDFRMDMAFEKRRDMSEDEAARLDSVERQMQWCWKQAERFAEDSGLLAIRRGNPRAMIECGQNPWKPSTLPGK